MTYDMTYDVFAQIVHEYALGHPEVDIYDTLANFLTTHYTETPQQATFLRAKLAEQRKRKRARRNGDIMDFCRIYLPRAALDLDKDQLIAALSLTAVPRSTPIPVAVETGASLFSTIRNRLNPTRSP